MATSSPVVPGRGATPADIIEDVFTPGSIALFSGPSGVGKTTLLADWCVRISNGQPIIGLPVTTPPAVAFLATDRPWRSHKKWFTAAGWADIPHYSLRDDLNYQWSKLYLRGETTKVFELALDRLGEQLGPEFNYVLPPGALVIIDTLMLFLPGNLIDYKATAIGIAQLDQIVQKRQLCVIGTAHHAKQKNDVREEYKRAQDRILGSAALLGYTDTQLYLLGPEDTGEDFHQVGVVSHHAPPYTFDLTRGPKGLFIPYKTPEDTATRMDLLHAFPLPPDMTTSGVIVEYAQLNHNLSRASTYRHLERLEQAGLIRRPKYGHWGLTDLGMTTLADKALLPSA